ncbi:MAG: thioredoxin family protein [Leptospira sp.]|jgi:thioredoxin 1|nr:thioredoxin family protein [Leptospira sp.]
MKRWPFAKASLAIYFSLLLSSFIFSCTSKVEPFSVFKAYEEAVQYAKKENKKILIIFGADWCPDCKALNQLLVAPEVKSFVQEKFLIFQVDVGKFDTNLDFNQKFGNPIENGIPALVIIDPKNQESILASTKGGEFSSASQMRAENVLSYLKQFQ